MKKATSFRHPVDARHDERIAAMIGERGALAYGVYWMIVEIIYRREPARIEWTYTMRRRMAAQVGMPLAEFEDLVGEMIYTYELFAVEDFTPSQEGYLVSTLIYRKPRKKATAIDTTPPAETVDTAPTGNEQQTGDITTTSTSEFSEKDLQLQDELRCYIQNNAPQVAALPRPFTPAQLSHIRAGYDEELILFTLEDLNQTPDLQQRYSSAYDAFVAFADR